MIEGTRMTPKKLTKRLVEARFADLVESFRVVVVNGPRQAGKTTLPQMRQHDKGGEYRSLDDDAWLAAARSDPATFVNEAELPLFVDEIQLGRDPLIRAIKRAVDTHDERGQFVLSGSTRFLTVPTLSESLAGRATILDLWPLAMAERVGSPGALVADIFASRTVPLPGSSWSRSDYLDIICAGSYPELPLDASQVRRRDWFSSYLTTVIQRDISEFSEVRHSQALPQLLQLIAARAGSTTVLADVAKALDVKHETARTYVSYLQTVFLIADAPAWSTNLTSRIAKTPKTFISDAGLAAHLLRVDAAALRRPGHPALGGLAETFVYTELLKLRAASEPPFEIYHLRDRGGQEVDFVLESWGGEIIGVEVKASVTPTDHDARHLAWLRDKLGDRFVAGIVLHMGTPSVSFGDRLFAVPISALWDHRELSGVSIRA